MSHARAQIRSAVAALLTGLSSTRHRVFPSRVLSLSEDQLPALAVYTIAPGEDEQVTRATLGSPPLIYRSLPVIIEGLCLADERVDDVLDQIAMEVEKAMSAEIQAGGKSIPMQLQSTSIDIRADGESQVGVVRLTYSASYASRESTPDVIG